jgi:hypothetical protein
VQALREAIRQEYREVVERRVFTVTGNRPDEEVNTAPSYLSHVVMFVLVLVLLFCNEF